uniref:Transglutaminase domain-containing protein n=1 Tax=Roseihalotalea indica TaxID=2867963 RepID=A0AA49GSD1_9BACT|nr:transglutaminase domain-containing protein [Tunicatimonas sp. TK19036]
MKYYISTFALYLVVLFPFHVEGNSDRDYTQIDQHARSAPEKLHYDVEKLTHYLVKTAQDDHEKVRSFYVWIADNIAYDVQLFRNYNPARYKPILPNDVLKRRRAVCQGYSELFQEMCRLADVPCYVVGGYSKGFAYTARKSFTNADHAWNAVQLDNEWHLVDVTWGSGGLDDNMRFVKKFNDSFFLTSPSEFVLNHLPLLPMWQLLDCPVSIKTYAQGDDAVKQYLNQSAKQCQDYQEQIANYEAKPKVDQSLFAAEQAYAFNPANPVVLARGYMNFANHLMNSIPTRLTSREAIQDATVTQEEALNYLKKADKLLSEVNDDSAEQEKKLIKANIQTSEQNLKGLKNALK